MQWQSRVKSRLSDWIKFIHFGHGGFFDASISFSMPSETAPFYCRARFSFSFFPVQLLLITISLYKFTADYTSHSKGYIDLCC